MSLPNPQTLAMASLLSLTPKPYLAKCCQLPESRTPALVSLQGFESGLVNPGKRRSVVVRGLTVNNSEKARVFVEKKREEKPNSRPIVVIDNYDGFTYNLCQYMGELGANFEVYRNDEITVQEVKSKNPSGILVSPGSGAPRDSGISLQTIMELGPSIPLFGVCMGLQCIGEAFGGNIVRAPSGVVHGKSSPVFYDGNQEDNLFHGLPNPFITGRYHSLVIENGTFPSDVLEITAWTEDGLVMAARHKKYKHILGVQFHPESIITKEGKIIIANFLKVVEKFERTPSPN